MARTWASWVTSACTVIARAPACTARRAVSLASVAECRKFTATAAPSRASASTIARPMPVAPPVTSAILPASLGPAGVTAPRSGEVIPRDVQVDSVRGLGLHRELGRPDEHRGLRLLEASHERRKVGRHHREGDQALHAARLARGNHHERDAAGPAEHGAWPAIVDLDLGQAEEVLEGLGGVVRR